jgi:hypothetical protein
MLTALFFAIVLSNCAQPEKGDELQQGAALLRDYALRSNPSLKGTRFKIDLSIDGALGDCMCIKVCTRMAKTVPHARVLRQTVEVVIKRL